MIKVRWSRSTIILFAMAVVITFSVFVGSVILLIQRLDTMRLNELGDFIAGVTAPIAAIWLLVAVFIQINELTLQRTDIENSLRELNEANKINRENFGELEKQNKIFTQQLNLDKSVRLENIAKSEIATHIYLFVQSVGRNRLRFENENYGGKMFSNFHKYENAIDVGYLFSALQQFYDDLVSLRDSDLRELLRSDRHFLSNFRRDYTTLKTDIETTLNRSSLSSGLIAVFKVRIDEIFEVCEEICRHEGNDDDDIVV